MGLFDWFGGKKNNEEPAENKVQTESKPFFNY